MDFSIGSRGHHILKDLFSMIDEPEVESDKKGNETPYDPCCCL